MTVRIETRRLLLRPFTPADAAAVEGYVGRWEIARMTTRIAHPYPAGGAATWIAGHAAARQHGSEHTFAVTLQGEDKAIGAISLRHTEPGNWELGYWLAPGHWGQGLATEAAQAMVVYGFEKLGVIGHKGSSSMKVFSPMTCSKPIIKSGESYPSAVLASRPASTGGSCRVAEARC